MTLPDERVGNGVARHFAPDVAPEDFRTFAAPQLDACAPWQPGICFLPECGRAFEQTRDWQIYCCGACERAGRAEMRKWGHRLALAALAWRMGKYEQTDPGLRDLASAARRHVGQVQSAWLADRQQRAKAARQTHG